MIYRLLGWDVVGGAYHKIQIVSCASAKLHLIMELMHRLRNILKWMEYGAKHYFDPSLNPFLVNKNKHING